MISFYRERESGDYISIDTETNAYYLAHGRDHFEGRCTAIANEVYSVCTCGLSREWLRKKCRRVAKKDVPKIWLKTLAGD